MTRFVAAKIETALKQQGILARVASRVKRADSLRAKLIKWANDDDIRIKGTVSEILASVSDLAAARVMTYTEQDRAKVEEVIRELFDSPSEYSTPFDFEKKRRQPKNKGKSTKSLSSEPYDGAFEER